MNCIVCNSPPDCRVPLLSCRHNVCPECYCKLKSGKINNCPSCNKTMKRGNKKNIPEGAKGKDRFPLPPIFIKNDLNIS